jgi:colanic acid/amylovoran biosynthesis glycosyltransferase
VFPSRIAYVLRNFPKYSETFIAGELAELRRRGTEIRILAAKRPVEGVRHAIIAEAGLDRLVTYGLENFPAVMEKFKPELIHAHFATEPTAIAMALGAEFKLPFTFTAHGYDIRRDPPADFAQRAAAAAALITVSQANARSIAKNFDVPIDRINVVPCGIDTDRFQPARISNADLPAVRTPLIVCVARLVPVKNLAMLLQACAILSAHGMKFRCVLVGDGDLREELEELRRKLNLAECVEMTGLAAQSEVLRWWQRATVAALSSHDEGMPVSLMEAGACGVPAVATRVGGIPELVEHAVTGLLTAPGDAQAMADALARILANPRLAASMGKAARRRVQEKFTLRRQVDQLLTLWQSY